ncbi:MAG: hypothetical protein QXJ27_04365, partial [Thermoplasmata archaeon]
GLAATQYAKLGVQAEAKVSTKYSFIQLMAGDAAVTGSGYILTNDTGTYKVVLGTFGKGFNKTYSAAFAIVNSESNVKLRITKIDFGTSDAIRPYAIVALHKTMSSNAFSDAAGAIVYYDKGTSYDYSDNGYVLRNGQGDYSTGSLQYTNNGGTNWYTASWDATNVWVYNSTLTDATGLTTDTNTLANFVWVQITIDLTGANDGTTLTGTLYIEVKSV